MTDWTAFDRNIILANGWKQGAIFTATDIEALSAHIDRQLNKKDCVIVLSQDCDVAAWKLNTEPKVEILVATPIEKISGGNANAKHPRELHFNVDAGEQGTVCYKASIHDRYYLQRDWLQTSKADSRTLSDGELVALRRWLVGRYDRTAMPDGFNNRIGKNGYENIWALLEEAKGIEWLLIRLDDWENELPDATPYKISICGVMKPDRYEAHDLRVEAENIMHNLSKVLNGCKGIEVDEREVRSSSEVSLADLDEWRIWNFDWVSMKVEGHDNPGLILG